MITLSETFSHPCLLQKVVIRLVKETRSRAKQGAYTSNHSAQSINREGILSKNQVGLNPSLALPHHITPDLT